jgi:DNA topoisomerase-3
VPTNAQPTPSCDFKTGRVILQQVIEHDQVKKLLAEGKTDLLEKFVSNKTRRAFKAYLTYDAEAGKVSFAFEPSKYPKKGGAPTTRALAKAAGKTMPGKKTPAAKKAAKAPKEAKPKAPRKAAAGKAPSPALAAVIGTEAVARTEVMKKLWDYIKAQGLQDPKDKRTIHADAKLKAVFGKDSVGMFEIAGLIGPHLSCSHILEADLGGLVRRSPPLRGNVRYAGRPAAISPGKWFQSSVKKSVSKRLSANVWAVETPKLCSIIKAASRAPSISTIF